MKLARARSALMVRWSAGSTSSRSSARSGLVVGRRIAGRKGSECAVWSARGRWFLMSTLSLFLDHSRTHPWRIAHLATSCSKYYGVQTVDSATTGFPTRRNLASKPDRISRFDTSPQPRTQSPATYAFSRRPRAFRLPRPKKNLPYSFVRPSARWRRYVSNSRLACV